MINEISIHNIKRIETKLKKHVRNDGKEFFTRSFYLYDKKGEKIEICAFSDCIENLIIEKSKEINEVI